MCVESMMLHSQRVGPPRMRNSMQTVAFIHTRRIPCPSSNDKCSNEFSFVSLSKLCFKESQRTVRSVVAMCSVPPQRKKSKQYVRTGQSRERLDGVLVVVEGINDMRAVRRFLNVDVCVIRYVCAKSC